MKTCFIYFLAYTLLSLGGCSSGESKVDAELVVSTGSLSFESNGETKTFHIKTNAKAVISSTADWCTIAFNQEEIPSTFPVYVTAGENPDLAERSAQIRITVENLSAAVEISQQKAIPPLPPPVADPELPEFIPPDQTGMTSDAPALAPQMKIGWNLGNSLEACSATSAGETLWGNPKTTKRLIDSVKTAGFNTVRIPCAWNGYIEDPENFKIRASWLKRVQEVVDYCIDNEMYALLNIHWGGGWLEENPFYASREAVNKKQQALWKQIAIHFRDYDEHLLFAGTNEVHADYGNPSPENIEVQLSYNQTFVDAVRATGGRNACRNLVVQAYNTNIGHAVDYFELPEDAAQNRLMLEVHYYDPYDFCLDASSAIYLWGKDYTGRNVSSWGQEDWVDERFALMKTHFIDRGIPVILGEYCATLRSSLNGAAKDNHIISRNYYLHYVTRKALENGLVPLYWDNGHTGDNGSGLFNRSTGNQVHPDAIRSIISPYTVNLQTQKSHHPPDWAFCGENPEYLGFFTTFTSIIK
ncbi:MAG: cellulase family glycosylhydrolase [Tannerellaceae bacterium]|jgi:endoglucanase|nr:cellulase family glycosylhydrolase [Tannerellaceae bacterium]